MTLSRTGQPIPAPIAAIPNSRANVPIKRLQDMAQAMPQMLKGGLPSSLAQCFGVHIKREVRGAKATLGGTNIIRKTKVHVRYRCRRIPNHDLSFELFRQEREEMLPTGLGKNVFGRLEGAVLAVA